MAPPKKPKVECDLEPYLQYHNRIASFLEWNLDWELSDDKPTPESLARAGFFYYARPPFEDDNVVCPYCSISLDSWDSQDDPMHEHRARAPFCKFVRGRQTVRDMGGGDDDNTASASASASGNANATDTQAAPSGNQNSATNVPRPKRPYKKRGAGASKASELALAGAKGEGEGPAKKRRPGRPKKQDGLG